MKKLCSILFLVFISLVSVYNALADTVPVNNDLWNGATVTGSSPILNHGGSFFVSSAGNMFGGTLSGSVEPDNTIFEDSAYYQGPQWITWQTATSVTVGSLNLFSVPITQSRTFSWFKLYANNSSTPILTFTPTTSFNGTFSTIITPVTAQDFRAEFGWGGVGGPWDSSVRVLELDGFAPIATPEPSTMLLLGLGLIGLAQVRPKFKK
jgi:hypothetical protein